MVQRFVGATTCSIWEHRPESKKLHLAAAAGLAEGIELPSILPDEASIEGWVVRNNMMFSVKMLAENEALAKLDTGRNIMTLPISAGRRIWGVLNIEEMPFAKYNLYAERLLLVIMALAGPSLERAIEFESVLRQEDTNPITGLPSYPQFYAMLQLELARLEEVKGTLAVIILELSNFDRLSEQHGRTKAVESLRDLAKLAQELLGGPSYVFHYKSEEQLALVCPNLDADGTSLFALNLLSKVNAREWSIAGERVFLELVLGFSARSGGGQSAEELMDGAEKLLEMQKV
jgi:GGDEF domain-containing protein